MVLDQICSINAKSVTLLVANLLLSGTFVVWLGATSTAAPDSGVVHHWTQADWSGGSGDRI